MRILVCGATGFIGNYCVSRLVQDGHDVIGLARDAVSAQTQNPDIQWRRGDFALLQSPNDWIDLLQGIDAVVNCVGVLQQGQGETLVGTHIRGPKALYAACERLNIRRVVHISAMGIDGNVTDYDRTKLQAEQNLSKTTLDWLILRPGLVFAATAYGGTALMRACASLPGFMLVPQGDYSFQTVAVEDLAAIVSKCLMTDKPRRIIEVGTPQVWKLPDLLAGLRQWLGLNRGRQIVISSWLVRFSLIFGDFAGWLGWPSGFRTMSLRQIEKGVTGPVPAHGVIEGVKLRTFYQMLRSYPNSDAQLLASKLYFVRPIVLITLALFWLVSGSVALGPGWNAAIEHMTAAGVSADNAYVLTLITSLLDIFIGLAILYRPWSQYALLSALGLSLAYLVGGTILEPELWIDPLGPFIKVVPAAILTIVALVLSGSKR